MFYTEEKQRNGGRLLQELEIVSTVDGTPQPVLFAAAQGDEPRPLLVGLHTWSAERHNQQARLSPLASERNWNLLLPEFRGPNLTTNEQGAQACGAPIARQDILDAVAEVQKRPSVGGPIFLYGGSGGGHMSLMMAAAAPQLWTAVSSWCPITDLFAWREQNPNYRPHIEHCCGGVPDDGEAVAAQYRERSPFFHADQIARSTLFIHHGKSDASVPFTHSLRLYEEIVTRRREARVFLEIFDGGHEAHAERALAWFDSFLEVETADEQTLSG